MALNERAFMPIHVMRRQLFRTIEAKSSEHGQMKDLRSSLKRIWRNAIAFFGSTVRAGWSVAQFGLFGSHTPQR